MGLFEKFSNFRREQHKKSVAKAVRTVKNAKAIREDRWASLMFLRDLKDPNEAIVGLLERFEYSLEHGINDTREKELAMEGIIEFKEVAIPFLQERLKSTTRIAWLIKMLKVLCNADQVRESLKQALNFNDVTFDQAAVDKNFDILCYLRDYQLGDFAPKLQRFIEDPDERVRFAAAEVLIEQEETLVKPMLECFLLDESSENSRIHEIVKECYLNKKWKLLQPALFEEGRSYAGFMVKRGLVFPSYA